MVGERESSSPAGGGASTTGVAGDAAAALITPPSPLEQGDAPQHPLILPARSRRSRWPWLLTIGLVAAGGGYAWWTGTPSSPVGDRPQANTASSSQTPVEAPVGAAAASQPQGAASFRDCETCPEMQPLSPGSFLMGASAGDKDAEPEERPQHPVTIAQPFALSRTEVTFAQWLACVADSDCDDYRPAHEGWGGGIRPVINVSWHDAENYTRWLSRKTGKLYRLPTEAEWEYATRAGTTSRYWWGDAIGEGLANCNGCGSNWDQQQTAPTASFNANPFGLFDVHGNVWEWVEDCWQPNYQAASPNGTPPNARRGCSKRTLRGGSWDNSPSQVRSSARIWGQPDGRDNNIGFRVALTLPPEAAPPEQASSQPPARP